MKSFLEKTISAKFYFEQNFLREKLTDLHRTSQELYLHIGAVSCFSERFKMSLFDI